MEAWVGIVILAAAVQTVRNAAQRSLTADIGTWGATWVRFVFGLPFAAAAVGLLFVPGVSSTPLPGFHPGYFAWLALGAVSQLAATACLLAAMQARHFVVAVTYSKTDALQVVVFAWAALGEWPGGVAALGVALASLGVLALSAPPGGTDPQVAGALAERRARLLALVWGLGSGAGFALSAVGYRGAALALGGVDPWVLGAWGVLLAQALQSLLLGAWLLSTQPQVLTAVARAWRVSLLAGGSGALASCAWFTAFALASAAQVRAVGLVEVLFSFAVSHRLLRERVSVRERWALCLVVVGLVAVLLGA